MLNVLLREMDIFLYYVYNYDSVSFAVKSLHRTLSSYRSEILASDANASR